MEEFTVELDDEIATWLESLAATQKKTISEVFSDLIAEYRTSPRPAQDNPG